MTRVDLLLADESLQSDNLQAESGAPEIEWLVDNIDAYDAIAAAVQGARTSISISQLAFDADFVVHREDSGGKAPVPFIDLLLSAARDRGVATRILLNSTLLLDTLKPLRRFVHEKNTGAARFEMRGMSHFPQLLHAKMLIVDSEIAFLLGSPFVNGYWDSPAHRPFDPNRATGELGGRPLHDVSVRICGTAVTSLENFFEELWSEGDELRGPRRRSPTTRGTFPRARSTGLARVRTTVPSNVLQSRPHGSMEILRALLSGLGRARSLIYIEHQYLSSRPVFRALRQALDREPDLEIIIVANQNPDVTAYARWQITAFRKFGLLDHPRVGIFTLWSVRDAVDGSRDLNQVFVHSKVVTIDDAWVMCGSANLDGVSLHSYADDFARWPGRRIFRGVRNVDVAVVIADAGAPEGSSALALREKLWREHLGDDTPSSNRPATGWVQLWRAIADRNVAALNDRTLERDASFILPYNTNTKPSKQLAACGVDKRAGGLKLNFNPGWIERAFSPRWVRNMFL